MTKNKSANFFGIYYAWGFAYMMDDFGNLTQVTFDQLGSISIFRSQEH